jgi:hypothetical protein
LKGALFGLHKNSKTVFSCLIAGDNDSRTTKGIRNAAIVSRATVVFEGTVATMRYNNLWKYVTDRQT